MTESIQGLYYGLAALSIIVSVGFAYVRLFVKSQLLEVRLGIVEDMHSEFATLRMTEEMSKCITLIELGKAPGLLGAEVGL